MFKRDAIEAAPLAARMASALLISVPTRGRPGSDLRRAVGDFIARALFLVQTDAAGKPLAECFDLARAAGVSQKQLAQVRRIVLAEEPISLGAVLVKNAGIALCLATEARIIADMHIVSRDDARDLKVAMNDVFGLIEEVAADDMDAMTYRVLVELHAAVTQHLVDTARPLPRLVGYQFASPRSTLSIAYRLYDDAGRADELRKENKIIHPAFSLQAGMALSA